MDVFKLKKSLYDALTKEQAHASIETVLEDISIETLSKQVEGLPYTIWQLVEHIRITQWDIVEFSANPGHKSPDWPEGYWPQQSVPRDYEQFIKTKENISSDLVKLNSLLDTSDLTLAFPYGNGQTLLREVLLVLAHNSYHLGQIVLMRRLLGDW